MKPLLFEQMLFVVWDFRKGNHSNQLVEFFAWCGILKKKRAHRLALYIDKEYYSGP